jgi:hypothetical protein
VEMAKGSDDMAQRSRFSTRVTQGSQPAPDVDGSRTAVQSNDRSRSRAEIPVMTHCGALKPSPAPRERVAAVAAAAE